ncbi:gluconate 2-dehydrogenase subunit 3 family protein [Halioxenophilus aromaticivorans]|uniref:Gluconate 2-dehydrogenase subunit 3 family protein n=1 Tax=Halioxenophilus aromaticivorans TaxID=1306992 RepID=A0AAV3UAJ7_9ALTE
MNRREFLQCAAVLTAGTAFSSNLFALSQSQQNFLQGKTFVKQKPTLYSNEQRTLVADIAETIIPKTDTPGATEAAVPTFIELMAQYWLNSEENETLEKGLIIVDDKSKQHYGKTFSALTAQQKQELLQQLEQSAAEHPWYQRGNVRRAFVSSAPFICMIKELTVWGYFTSEIGCKQALRYNPMPMHFDGEVTLQDGEAAWAEFRL